MDPECELKSALYEYCRLTIMEGPTCKERILYMLAFCFDSKIPNRACPYAQILSSCKLIAK
jgi:hypothetical protein